MVNVARSCGSVVDLIQYVNAEILPLKCEVVDRRSPRGWWRSRLAENEDDNPKSKHTSQRGNAWVCEVTWSLTDLAAGLAQG